MKRKRAEFTQKEEGKDHRPGTYHQGKSAVVLLAYNGDSRGTGVNEMQGQVVSTTFIA